MSESLLRVIGMVGDKIPAMVSQGTVTQVNGNECIVEREGKPPLKNVRLLATTQDHNSFIRLTPKIGSTVLCIIIEKTISETFIIGFDQIDSFHYKVEELELHGTKEGIRIFNQGENFKEVLNDFFSEFGKLCDELSSVVVNLGKGPNVPVINKIKQQVTDKIRERTNKIIR